jgi:hypothetical protein
VQLYGALTPDSSSQGGVISVPRSDSGLAKALPIVMSSTLSCYETFVRFGFPITDALQGIDPEPALLCISHTFPTQI